MYSEIVRLRSTTHAHVIGSTNSGKSSFLEWLMRQDIASGRGFCLIDPHGTTFANTLKFAALARPLRPIYVVNPSDPQSVVPVSPFSSTQGDIATVTARRVSAIAKAWGSRKTDDQPRREKIMSMVLHACAAARLPLPAAAQLLYKQNGAMRQNVIAAIENPAIRALWQELDGLPPARFQEVVESTVNWLQRFSSQLSIRRFLGQVEGNISIDRVFEEDAIVLGNLAPSKNLDGTGARVFGALWLSEFLEAAMRRAGRVKRPYALYCDEFPEFMSGDAAPILDGGRKGGLHLVLSSQRLGQLQEDPQLFDAVMTNCKMRFVFGGLSVSTASTLAEEMFLSGINKDQVKREVWRTSSVMQEETRETYSVSESRTEGHSTNWNETEGESATTGTARTSGMALSEGEAQSAGTSSSHGLSDGKTDSETESDRWNSSGSGTSLVKQDSFGESSALTTSRGTTITQSQTSSEAVTINLSKGIGGGANTGVTKGLSVSTIPFLNPKYFQELSSVSFYSRDEKVSRFAERLINQPQRHVYAKLGNADAFQFVVPMLRTVRLSRQSFLEYERSLYLKAGALDAATADKRLADTEAFFLERPQTEDFVIRRSPPRLAFQNVPPERSRSRKEKP